MVIYANLAVWRRCTGSGCCDTFPIAICIHKLNVPLQMLRRRHIKKLCLDRAVALESLCGFLFLFADGLELLIKNLPEELTRTSFHQVLIDEPNTLLLVVPPHRQISMQVPE